MNNLFWVQFAAICLIGAMSPGPSMALIIRNSIKYGRISGILFSLGHAIAGLFAVLAMSLGTAIAIALLAAFSVYCRRTAQRIVQSKHDTRHLVGVIPTILGILGGGLIFIFGVSFFISALTAPAHPFR